VTGRIPQNFPLGVTSLRDAKGKASKGKMFPGHYHTRKQTGAGGKGLKKKKDVLKKREEGVKNLAGGEKGGPKSR